jgi:hypothetical protein
MMYRNLSGTIHTCSLCGKDLEQRLCYNCGGEGQTRVLLFFKKDCEICGGVGTLWRCPDEFKDSHLRLVSSVIGRNTAVSQNLKPLGKPTIQPPQPQIKTPKQQVPPPLPPWDPRNPNVLNPMHPRSPYNPNNPNSPLNPGNPRNPNHPMNPMNPNSPLNPRNKPFKK